LRQINDLYIEQRLNTLVPTDFGIDVEFEAAEEKVETLEQTYFDDVNNRVIFTDDTRPATQS
jgi:hypothetical protein